MKTIMSIVVGVLVLAESGYINQHGQSVSSDSLERNVEFSNAERMATEDAFSRVLGIAGVPGGIVSKQNCGEPGRYTFISLGSTVRDVLDSIVSTDHAYRWRLEEGVVNLVPASGEPALLNLRLAKFNVENANTVYEALDRLPKVPLVRKRIAELGLSPGFARIGISDLNRPGSEAKKANQLSLSAEDMTVREILNAIVRAHGRSVWAYTERKCQGRNEFSINFVVQ